MQDLAQRPGDLSQGQDAGGDWVSRGLKRWWPVRSLASALIQAASDPLLGWYSLEGFDGRPHDFYVRQLWDGKASIEIAQLTGRGLAAYGEACGWTLARAHARSGDRIAIAAYLGDDPAFDEAITAFAISYADTNDKDHALLAEAVEEGRLAASTR